MRIQARYANRANQVEGNRRKGWQEVKPQGCVMKTTKVRIPTTDELEAIVLEMGLRIMSIREEAGGKTYTLQIGEHMVEVPSKEWWRIVEVAE